MGFKYTLKEINNKLIYRTNISASNKFVAAYFKNYGYDVAVEEYDEIVESMKSRFHYLQFTFDQNDVVAKKLLYGIDHITIMKHFA